MSDPSGGQYWTAPEPSAVAAAFYLRAADVVARGGASARTILAMGEIAPRLQVDQDSSRARFSAIFGRFARWPGHRMSRLGQPCEAPAEAAASASARPAR